MCRMSVDTFSVLEAMSRIVDHARQKRSGGVTLLRLQCSRDCDNRPDVGSPDPQIKVSEVSKITDRLK
jgi:hypothetical protein